MDFYLKINGVRIEWASRNKIRLERYNPIFDYETVQGSRVADFTIPFSPLADKLFNWYYLPQSQYKSMEYYCEKYVYGDLVERGFVYLVDVNNEGYVVAFTQNLGEFFGDYQTVKLNKLPLGSEAIPAAFDPNPNYLTAKYVLPTILNEGFYGGEEAAWYNGRINDFTGGVYTATGTKTPLMLYRSVFDMMASLCNFRYEGDFFETDFFKRMLFYNTFSLDDATTIEYANHLPNDLTFPELLIELRKLFNVAFFFDVQRRVITGKLIGKMLRKPTKLIWTDKIMPSKNRTPLIKNRLSLDWEVDSDDNLLKVVPPDFLKYDTPVLGGGVPGQLFEIKSRLSTLNIDTASGLAITHQGGISKRLQQTAKDSKPRILFWNGMVAGVPTATHKAGNVRLAWHGVDNLVDNFWRETESWRQKTSMKPVLANLTAGDLASLDWHRNNGENICLHSKGKDYYIANIKANLPLNSAVEMELWER
jgi:hypothetical protein